MTDQTFRIDRQEGRILGVCAGLARSTGIDVTLVRVAAVIGTLAGLGLPAIAAYCVAGWLGRDERR